MPEIKAFIFDLDGVITDTAELHFLSWQHVTQAEGLPFTREDNEHLRGLSRYDSLMRILALDGRELDPEAQAAWMRRKNDHFLASLANLTPADILPGVTDLLYAAQYAGLKIGLASSSRNARGVLDKLSLTPVFDVIGDGYSIVNAKPAPDLFLWVAGRLDVNPAEVIVFEDGEAGVAAALAGGFWVVGVGSADVRRAHLTFPSMAEVTFEKVIDGIEALKQCE